MPKIDSEKCDRCGVIYETTPFSNMSADGELKYSHVEIYGIKRTLCPGCTHLLNEFILNNVKFIAARGRGKS